MYSYNYNFLPYTLTQITLAVFALSLSLDLHTLFSLDHRKLICINLHDSLRFNSRFAQIIINNSLIKQAKYLVPAVFIIFTLSLCYSRYSMYMPRRIYAVFFLNCTHHVCLYICNLNIGLSLPQKRRVLHDSHPRRINIHYTPYKVDALYCCRALLSDFSVNISWCMHFPCLTESQNRTSSSNSSIIISIFCSMPRS